MDYFWVFSLVAQLPTIIAVFAIFAAIENENASGPRRMFSSFENEKRQADVPHRGEARLSALRLRPDACFRVSQRQKISLEQHFSFWGLRYSF